MDYRPTLDGMRGVAVTAVVALHIDLFHAHAFLPGGWAGVDVFFVLSGFLITTILLEGADRTGRIDFRDFYFRRVVRLAPALLLLVLVLSVVALTDDKSRGPAFTNILLSLTYLMNWNRAFGWFPAGDWGGFLAHTWSLSVEEQFYLIWPAALLLLMRVRRHAALITLGMVAVAFLWRVWLAHQGAGYWRTYSGSDTHADPILMGCFLAFVPGLIHKYSAIASKLALIPVLLLAIILLKMHLFSNYGVYIGSTLAGACSVWILVGTYADGFLARALSVRPLVYTGRISYGWYLWHYPLLYIADHGRHHHLSRIDTAVLVLIAYGIAAASFHFVERPISVRFKHLLNRGAGRDVRRWKMDAAAGGGTNLPER